MYLVVGANGQLGNELKLILGDRAVYVDRDDMDITDLPSVKAFVEGRNFKAIINCAAYTAVDKAEDEQDLCRMINVAGPMNLAITGIPLVHVSTDYVFDGLNFKPYQEDDVRAPQSVYGLTKMNGEEAMSESARCAVIIRTSWLYSTFGNNFVKTMRKLGSEHDSLNVVFDQIGTPTYAKDLAEAIVAILPKMKPGVEIYHFSNEGACSWYDFAVEIMKMSGLKCKVNPIEGKDYPTKAARPFYSVLNKAKIKKDFGLTIRHWREALSECVEGLK